MISVVFEFWQGIHVKKVHACLQWDKTLLSNNLQKQKISLDYPITQPTFTCSKSTIKMLETCDICSKLTMETPERRHWRCSGVFIANFEHISHLFLIKKTLWLLFMDGVWLSQDCKPLRGDSLLFNTKSPGVPDTHFIDLRRMKGWGVELGATQWFWTRDPWIGNPVP